MTSQKSDNYRQKSKIVVRGYGGEPVEMRCQGSSGGRVTVARPGRTQTLSVPVEIVFKYAKGLYEQLREAWAAGDKQRLAELWKSAGRAFQS
jgi:hypothetical protein